MLPSAQLENLSELNRPVLGKFDTLAETRKLFQFMKGAPNFSGLAERGISFSTPSGAPFVLVPLGQIHLEDTEAVKDLTDWRIAAKYRGDEGITEAGTAKWQKSAVYENEDRVLFFVTDQAGNRHGHLGLWVRHDKHFEIDNVIKSPSSHVKGLMTNAVKALAIWTNEYLNLRTLNLRVDVENAHAIRFYESIGFSKVASEGVPKEYETDEFSLFMTIDTERIYAPEYSKKSEGTILTAGPSIGPYERSLVSDAIAGGWNNHHSDYLNEFSAAFNSYSNSSFSHLTDSCTSALHLALWALGVGPGDEVIVPNVTWVATATAVRYVGATPVFADVDPLTWCISPESVESLITEKTKAIMPVHLYGYVADLAKLSEICKKHGLSMVQDAAPAIGAMFEGKSITDYGDFTCFSFQGAKMLVTGEGGLLTTNNEELFLKAKRLVSYGRVPDSFWLESFGKKMQMSNPTAALGLGQLQSIERQISKKREIRSWYQEIFGNHKELRMQLEKEDTRSICWMSSITWEIEEFDSTQIRSALKANKIDTRQVFPPISTYPFWTGNEISRLDVSGTLHSRALNLPSGVNLSEDAVKLVANTVVRELGLA